MKSKFWKYFKTGFKLFLIGILGGLIMIIPFLFSSALFLINTTLAWIVWIIFIIMGLIVHGYLIIKFRKFIFKGMK